MHNGYESADPGESPVAPEPPPDRIIQSGFTPNEPPPSKKRNTPSYKSLYEQAQTRFNSMKFTASLFAILAGIEALGIVILLLK
jgi:hypothetical protein